MRITVTKLLGNNIWGFNSKVGPGAGHWSGKTAPVIDAEYDIEIDIDDKIDEGHSAFLSGKHKYFMDISKDNIVLNGTIENIEEDGMVFFRLSQDCLFMIEGGDHEFKANDWISLKVKAASISLWPF